MAITILLVLAIAAGGVGWWLGSGRYTNAPQLVGLAVDAAEVEAREAGLDPVVDQVFSESVPGGEVIETDPGAGSELLRGSDIAITVSQGPERFTVDAALLGRAEADVAAALAEIPIRVVRGEDYSADVPVGAVLGFDPEAGTELRRDQDLTMVVSLGPAPRAVPEVAGLDRDEASAALTDQGFVVSVREDFSNDVESGIAIGTEPGPDAGDRIFGSAVTLVMSKGQDLVVVPDVGGLATADAVAAIEAAGLVAETTAVFGADVVLRQTPAEGERVLRGASVQLLLSFG